ncbi:hypothetical protein [Prevotella koreensis]|uniref:hypothetical protein n=1 Tax=Prevotella koreensis TaxID=2490854 RepID=UPI0028EEFFCC|nr:hypothetical protein [Prevotella koreensis]
MKKAFYLFSCLLLCACWAPFPSAHERAMQVGRFRPNINNNIEEKINIDGYYVNTNHKIIYNIDKPFILYNDGTYGNFSFENEDSIYKQKNDSVDFKNQLYYGLGGYYEVKGDTIEVDAYIYYQLSPLLMKRYFKIIDRNHLFFFKEIWVKSRIDDEPEKPCERAVFFELIPNKRLPPSTKFRSKLKKWIWEDKKDWKNYKKAYKEAMKKK